MGSSPTPGSNSLVGNMTNYKFSIITPTHIRNSFLNELYQSLQDQIYQNWEWVLYLNSGATPQQVPDLIHKDPRVRIIQGIDYPNANVGFMKKQAFAQGTGEILVEVDHDDLLTPDCLSELNLAFQDQSVGFAYSNDAMYHMQDKFVPYNKNYGWDYSYFNWQGRDLVTMHSFPPSSQSLSFIWYAPDHVRAWRRSVYEEVGGHNPGLSVCDDHELMIKTYLVTEFAHIPKCLYIYRITGENTWIERNELIQTKTRELFDQHAWQLALRDAKKQGLMAVDLGGGIDAKPGCVTIDLCDADIIADLNQGIPLPDNSVGVINASHLLEHLRDPLHIMKEIHRVLVDGGWAFIEVPSTDGRGAWQDPTHVSYWNENSFWYYTRQDKARYIRNTEIRFQEFKLETRWWDNQIAVVNAWLVALKQPRYRPHSVNI